MKIAVVAANGRVGRLVVEEAVKRGADVTAIARTGNKTDAQHFVKKDIMDLTSDDLEGFDVVVDEIEHTGTLGAHVQERISVVQK